jgi:phage major head subunit gpT-like protein
MRKAFEFEALERNSENGFLRDQYLYGIRARYNAGFGDWRCAFGAQVG